MFVTAWKQFTNFYLCDWLFSGVLLDSSALEIETVESALLTCSDVKEAAILPIENSNPSCFSSYYNMFIIYVVVLLFCLFVVKLDIFSENFFVCM